MIASYWVATNFILEAGDFMWFVRDKRVQRMNALENTPENFDKILKLLRSYTLDSKVAHENRRLVIHDRIETIRALILEKNEYANEMLESMTNKHYVASITAASTYCESLEYKRLKAECVEYSHEVDVYTEFQKAQLSILRLYMDSRKADIERMKKILRKMPPALK